ncbi:MAG TPA: HIT domain-containing protein [Candidatus Kapabacteria bacterium]|nr:HIT domain-containing protein [Candidatus Kapabacteria bacterium]
MERLWSPWRSQYIESFQGEKKRDGCVFCAAFNSNDDAANYLIHRDKDCFILMNLYPYNNGHLLIIPNRHVSALSELTPAEKTGIMGMTELGIAMLKKSMEAHGYNVGANFGRAAGAGIEDHLHYHIVPRWNGDTNFMPVLNEVKTISEEMGKTFAKLIEAKKSLLH